MPRKKAKHINYMDMKIPFDSLPIPKARKEQEKFVERFGKEFGANYRLHPFIAPCTAINEDGSSVYAHNSLEEKMRRILTRRRVVKKLHKALAENDIKTIEQCNALRALPPLPSSDDGWNITIKEETDRKRRDKRAHGKRN